MRPNLGVATQDASLSSGQFLVPCCTLSCVPTATPSGQSEDTSLQLPMAVGSQKRTSSLVLSFSEKCLNHQESPFSKLLLTIMNIAITL